MERRIKTITQKTSLTSRATIAGISVTALLAVVVGYIIVTSHAATNGFVTRTGNHLMLNGSVFRFSGANLYWVGLDDNIRDGNGNPTYPTHFRIDNGFDAATAMHAGVARTHSIGISIGCSTCLEPSRGVFNDTAFESIDYAVQSAGKHGIKLQVPLIDEWRYYHGGKWNFVHWAYQAGVSGVKDTNPDLNRNAGNDSGSATSEKILEEQFYTNPTIIADYKVYVSHILNHVNQYTGVALKDDPTIMDWETGNEIFDAPTSWTSMMASYIKTTVGAKQLVADGSAASGNHVSNADLTDPNVDIVGDHFYDYPSGLDTSWLTTDAANAKSNNKVLIVGEYAWTRSDAPGFLNSIESNADVAGDMLWAILPRKEDGSPEAHGSNNFGDDDVPLYYPTTSTQMQTTFTNLAHHSLVMNGTAPTPTPTAPPTPVPTPTPLPTPTGSTLINDSLTGQTPGFTYTGSWATSTGTEKYSGDDHYTSSGNDTSVFSFTGTRAQIYGSKASHYGIATFSVDGKAATTVDLYSAARIDQVVIFDSGVLTAGSHTILIKDTGTKNASSTSTVISIDVAAYVAGGTASTPIPTPTTTPTALPVATKIGDANNDGVVNVTDLSILLSKWGTNYPAADFNKDQIVNITDLSLLLSHYGK